MIILLTTLVELLALLFIMRFYMRLCLVGGNAPLANFVAKTTNPFTRIISSLLPQTGNIDLAAVIVAYGLLLTQAYLIHAFSFIDSQSMISIGLFDKLLYAAIKFIKIFLDLVFFAILATVIFSWVSPNSPSPLSIQLFHPLTDWILQPIRRVIPTLGMIDFSPLIALFVLQLLENFIVNRLLN